jgi:hypothetical protein
VSVLVRLMMPALAVLVVLGATAIAAAQNAAAPIGKRRASEHASRRHYSRPVAETSRPIAIPQTFAPPQEALASFPQAAAEAPAAPSPCQLQLTKIAAFQALPVLVGPGECGARDAVLLQDVIMPDHSKVAIMPAATLRCAMAEAIADWLRDDVGPAALKLGAPVRELDNLGSYECRGFNRMRGATLSEHGLANALDVGGFKLANGKLIRLTDIAVAKDWRADLRRSACARFTTVLGPGSDSYHEEHIHLDLAERRGGYRICQWDVREAVAQTEKPEGQAAPSAAKSMGNEELVPMPRPKPSWIEAADPAHAR